MKISIVLGFVLAVCCGNGVSGAVAGKSKLIAKGDGDTKPPPPNGTFTGVLGDGDTKPPPPNGTFTGILGDGDTKPPPPNGTFEDRPARLVFEAGKSTLVIEWDPKAYKNHPEQEPAHVNIDLVRQRASPSPSGGIDKKLTLTYVMELYHGLSFKLGRKNWEIPEDAPVGNNYAVHVWSYAPEGGKKYERYNGKDKGLGLSPFFSIVSSDNNYYGDYEDAPAAANGEDADYGNEEDLEVAAQGYYNNTGGSAVQKQDLVLPDETDAAASHKKNQTHPPHKPGHNETHPPHKPGHNETHPPHKPGHNETHPPHKNETHDDDDVVQAEANVVPLDSASTMAVPGSSLQLPLYLSLAMLAIF